MISISIFPYSFSIGDYRAIIIDIARDSLLGASTISILSLIMRQLISSNPSAVIKYLNKVKLKVVEHEIRSKLEYIIIN